VLSDFAGLGVHRDVPEGVRILRRHGLRLVALTNGSADVADGLLTRAGLRGEFQGPPWSRIWRGSGLTDVSG
jgi:2-haloacid dehalogenase